MERTPYGPSGALELIAGLPARAHSLHHGLGWITINSDEIEAHPEAHSSDGRNNWKGPSIPDATTVRTSSLESFLASP
jgi:hypothetical protein